MGPLFHVAANFWWLVFPVGGTIGGAVRAVAAANERRAERRLERYRLKQQAKIAIAQANGQAKSNEYSSRRELTKLVEQHNRTDARWLAVRRRRSDFSADEQQRLTRAKHLLQLARDEAASPQERQSAYARAGSELDGLIVLPAVVRAEIERRIAGQIEA